MARLGGLLGFSLFTLINKWRFKYTSKCLNDKE